jgi:hypothetical protein
MFPANTQCGFLALAPCSGCLRPEAGGVLAPWRKGSIGPGAAVGLSVAHVDKSLPLDLESIRSAVALLRERECGGAVMKGVA